MAVLLEGRMMRCARRLGVVGLTVLAAAGCRSDQVTGPAPFEAVSCVPPADLLVGAHPQPFGFPALRDAFLHAAGTMAAALGSSDHVRSLSQAIYDLSSQANPTNDTACRLLLIASTALKAMPQTPESLPDRDGIRLVLILAAGVVKAGTP